MQQKQAKRGPKADLDHDPGQEARSPEEGRRDGQDEDDRWYRAGVLPQA